MVTAGTAWVCEWDGDEHGGMELHGSTIHCPYGKPGDRLWVRETWSADFEWPLDGYREILPWEKMPAAFRSSQAACSVYYAADRVECHPPANGLWAIPRAEQPTAAEWDALRWRPSIHMPRWASRLALEVTGVRVEWVKDISADDARAEGVEPHFLPADSSDDPFVAGFVHLWDSINGHASWDANPWVWVIEFKVAA